MSKKRSVKEILIKSEHVVDGEASYDYSLYVRESSRVASYRIPLYTVTVEMTLADGKTTFAEAKDAFADIGKALVFYERMIEHRVTPLNLPYVLEDEYCT